MKLDQAIDERNRFLCDAFGKDIGSARTIKSQKHTYDAHLPEVAIRFPDGTIVCLTESRRDYEGRLGVTDTHTITLTEKTPKMSSTHLFNMPESGNEEKRRICQARLTISSAIDKCRAVRSAERFVVDKWVDGKFLPGSYVRDYK